MGEAIDALARALNEAEDGGTATPTYTEMARYILASDWLREAKAEAWDEGHAASERDWGFTFDLSTPDEERQPLTNPYRD